VLDEKRKRCNELRNSFQQIQRKQFDAEKKVAIADTSIQNLQRAIHQIEEEASHEEEQIHQLKRKKKRDRKNCKPARNTT
jgi:chromosome segregation protein